MKFVKALLVVALLALLVIAAAPTSRVAAQQGVTWTTGFQLQNLSGSAATAEIKLINRDGSTATTLSGVALGGGASKTYFPIPDVADGFEGSAIISADQPVAAILNILGNNGGSPFYSGSATGISEGSDTVGLPLIMRNNSGFDTWFEVQNVGTATTDVTVNYLPGSEGSATTDTKSALAPGASVMFNQAELTALGDKFIGSATVSADQPLAVIANQVGKTGYLAHLAYDGFPAGGTTFNLPLVMANNSGFFTGITVQALSTNTADANVTIDYGVNTKSGVSQSPPDTTATLKAGASIAVLTQSDDVVPATGSTGSYIYIGSAVVSSNVPVVAIVNQLGGLGTDATGVGTAYEGFDPSTATNTASAPLIMSNNGGFFTGIQCLNVGTVATALNVAYSANTVGSTFDPADEPTASIEPGASVTLLQAGNTWGNGTTDTAKRYVGSATITANDTNAQISCIVNELSLPAGVSGDRFLTYDAINVQ